MPDSKAISWKSFFKGFTIFPGMFIFSALAFYFHTAVVLNRFPSYANPDPKELTIYPIYFILIQPIMLVWFYSFPFWN